jgi:cytochrome b subunit of formate dehydrogenase
MFGITIIAVQWRWAVNHIYSIAGLHSDVAMTAFVSITQSAFYVIGAIVVFLVTGLTLFNWTQTSSIASSLAAQLSKTVTKSAETEVKR